MQGGARSHPVASRTGLLSPLGPDGSFPLSSCKVTGLRGCPSIATTFWADSPVTAFEPLSRTPNSHYLSSTCGREGGEGGGARRGEARPRQREQVTQDAELSSLAQPRGTRGDAHLLRLESQTPGNPHAVKRHPPGSTPTLTHPSATRRDGAGLRHSFGAGSARTKVDAPDARPSRRPLEEEPRPRLQERGSGSAAASRGA